MSRQPSEGRMAYYDIAEELSGMSWAEVQQLMPEAVELAREYAKRNHQKWPPKPRVSGWTFQIFTMGGGDQR